MCITVIGIMSVIIIIERISNILFFCSEGSSSTVGIILGVVDPVIILIIAINSLCIINR